VMPAYYRTEDLRRVARQYEGKPVLSAQEVEDAVAYLSTLR
jgi:L-cysteine S-thiosulfotransferase